MKLINRIRYALGAIVCRLHGHSSSIEVEESVFAEYDNRGRMIDCDGGRVDWFCPRCGVGGHSYF